MSVAFAAPRQRGKGEITPAAIQKVKARGAGRQVQPALGRHAGPARAAGAGAGLRGTVAEAPRSAAAPEWAATLSARRVPRAGALPCGHKARVPAAGSPREGAVRARRAGKAVGPAAPSPGPRVVPKLLWRGLAQRALAARCRTDFGLRKAALGRAANSGSWGAPRRTWGALQGT